MRSRICFPLLALAGGVAAQTSSYASSSSASSAAPGACKTIQYAFPSGTNSDQTAKAEAVRDAYLRSWDAYVEYAWGEDTLLPLTKSSENDWNGWGVTIVDALDTAIVMNLTDVVAKQLAWVQSVDFTATNESAEIFDLTIRYIGGMLGGYDLLKSGLFPDTYDDAQVQALLTQAATLADGFKPAFDTPTGLSATHVNFTTKTAILSTDTVNNVTFNATGTAVSGTFVMEWFRLTDLTGDASYKEIIEQCESWLVNPHPAPAYPGIVGATLDLDTGAFMTKDGGWHGSVDSFLEYLIKSYVYDPTDNATTSYKDFWVTAVASTEQYLALHPYGFPELTFITELNIDGSIGYFMDDFSSFAGGNLLLGGVYLDRPDMVDLGLAVTDSCHYTYNTTATGLGPQQWGWSPNSTTTTTGYEVQDPSWELRPECIESIFYAWRITGDTKWRDYAWEIFQAVNATASTPVAVAEVLNVTVPGGGGYNNYLDSFYFAEVLKYLYLTFVDPDVVSLDRFVFNTEAHPLLIQSGTCAAS